MPAPSSPGRSRSGWSVRAACVAAALLLAAWAVVADVGWYERHVAPSYCIDRPTWPWQVVRALAAGLAVVLAVAVRPRLGRLVARLPRRERVVVGLACAAALVAALGVGELLLRRARWDDQLGGPSVVELRPDARLGWTAVPDRTRSGGRDGRRFTYFMDGHGDRVRRPGDLVDPDAPTLVVAGESIAFGHGLDWDDTFYARVGRAVDLQVVNAAMPAYSTGQAYLRLLDTLPRLRRPRLVVVVFAAIQIRRNVAPTRPHFELDSAGAIVALPPETGLAAWRLPRLFTDEPYHDGSALDVTRALLVATDAAIRARGAEPLFLVTNYGPPCRDPGAHRELFAGLRHVRVDLTDPEDVLGPDDPHPSVAASRKLADAVITDFRSLRSPPGGGVFPPAKSASGPDTAGGSLRSH